MGDFQLTLHHLFQQVLLYAVSVSLNDIGNAPGMVLQFLYEFLQIGNKAVLMEDKLHRLQQLFRPIGIKLPQIIFIVLVQSPEVFMDVLPPFVDFFRTFLFHDRRLCQALRQS